MVNRCQRAGERSPARVGTLPPCDRTLPPCVRTFPARGETTTFRDFDQCSARWEDSSVCWKRSNVRCWQPSARWKKCDVRGNDPNFSKSGAAHDCRAGASPAGTLPAATGSGRPTGKIAPLPGVDRFRCCRIKSAESNVECLDASPFENAYNAERNRNVRQLDASIVFVKQRRFTRI